MNHQPRKLLENYRDLQYTKNEKILNGKLHFLRSVTFFEDGSRNWVYLIILLKLKIKVCLQTKFNEN